MENWREEMIAAVRKLYGDSDQPVAIVDGSLTVVWANDAALARYETLHTPDGMRTLIPGEYLLQAAQALAARQAQAIRREQIPLFSADICFTPLGQQGEETLAIVNFQPLPAGGPYSDSGGANRAISAFSGHIRGPLNVIFAMLSSLMRKGDIRRGSQQYEPLAMISRQSYRILRHCVNLTEFARFGSGLQETSLSVRDLAAELEALCASAGELTREAGIPLEFTAKCPSAFCRYDADMLQTAFFNILSNACRYTREGNAIHVSLETRGARALICITDRGMGIPEKYLPRIFEPFFSLADASGEAGCGLGLTVARMCMTAQEGSISVESQQGQGTTVALSLPLAPPPQELTFQAPEAMDALCDRFSSMYILLSDVCPPPDP